MNIGDIGEDLEAIDFAHTRFTEAVEGPCMEDYTSDEEAYQRLGEALQQLREAADRLIKRLPPGTLAVSRSRAPQVWCAEENRKDNPALTGCTGEGRPSCTAVSCMYGIESCSVCGRPKSIGVPCGFVHAVASPPAPEEETS